MVIAWWPTLKRKAVESHRVFSPPFSHYARPMCTMSEKRVCIDEWQSRLSYRLTLSEKWLCIDEWFI